jgi:hypothetical protein
VSSLWALPIVFGGLALILWAATRLEYLVGPVGPEFEPPPTDAATVGRTDLAA